MIKSKRKKKETPLPAIRVHVPTIDVLVQLNLCYSFFGCLSSWQVIALFLWLKSFECTRERRTTSRMYNLYDRIVVASRRRHTMDSTQMLNRQTDRRAVNLSFLWIVLNTNTMRWPLFVQTKFFEKFEVETTAVCLLRCVCVCVCVCATGARHVYREHQSTAHLINFQQTKNEQNHLCLEYERRVCRHDFV